MNMQAVIIENIHTPDNLALFVGEKSLMFEKCAKLLGY
jgi:hypothetical protein